MLAFLRQVVSNRIIDEHRRRQRRPVRVEFPNELPAEETSPMEAAIGVETMERYEAALAALREKDRQMIVLHVEFGMKPAEIAEALNLSSSGAARMALQRALTSLATEMNPDR